MYFETTPFPITLARGPIRYIQAPPQSRHPLTFNVIFPVPITGSLWHCNYFLVAPILETIRYLEQWIIAQVQRWPLLFLLAVWLQTASIHTLLEYKACGGVAEPETPFPRSSAISYIWPKISGLKLVPLPSIPGTVPKEDEGAWFQLVPLPSIPGTVQKEDEGAWFQLLQQTRQQR